MADYTQIIDLTDDKLTTLHKNLHGDIEDSAVVEAHHLVTTEMARRGLDHGHVDDAWAFAQVEVDSIESIDLENVTTELSDELAIEVAKTIGISGDVKVVLGVNGYEMQIEKSQDEIDDLEFDVLAGDVEKTIRRRNGKYTVFSADGSREFGTYDSKKEAEERLAQIERFKEIDKAEGYTPPAAVREAAQRALDWIGEGKAGQGFTSVGRGRARQLASGDSVGVDTLKRMRSFLARHIVDKKAEGFSRGEKGYPTPGRVAWDAWGGDAGRAWVESILEKLEKSENPEMYDPEDYLNDRQAILYATLENTVAEFGAFNEGIGADGAHYMSEENNPFASKGINCANCVFFEGGGGCEILNIEVEPMGACKFWIIPEKNLDESMIKHEAHDQLSHGSWAGEGGGSSIASRIKNNLSRYQMQESYGQNYDEGKKAKQQAPRTGQQSYDNYKTQRDKFAREIEEFPDRSFQAESYASLLAEAQGFLDGFDGKRPIVPIGKYQLSNPFPSMDSFFAEFPSLAKHQQHDQSSHGSWAGTSNRIPQMVENKKGESSSEANAAAQRIRDKVASVEPALTQTIVGIADSIGAEMAGLEHRLKTEKSLAKKIQNDSVEYNGNIERAADNINDAVRYTLIFKPEVYTDSATKTIDGMRDSGYQFERIKNFWRKGDDYQGINGKVRHPDGFKFEVQFHTKSSFDTKEKTHPLREKRIASPSVKEQWKLFSQGVRMASKTVVPAGVLAVGDLTANPLVVNGREILFMKSAEFNKEKGDMYRFFIKNIDNKVIAVYRLLIDNVNEEFIEERWDTDNWVDSSPQIFDHLLSGNIDIDEVEESELLKIAPEIAEKTKQISQSFDVSKAVDEKRFTLGPMYIPNQMDAHNEWTDEAELQQAVWKYVQSGDRRIRLQHNRDVVAGEWVEIMTLPYQTQVPMLKADGTTQPVNFPQNTVFLGVIWDDWAWDKIKKGEIRGYSIGGRAERMYVDLDE
jgi:hypothetical protein